MCGTGVCGTGDSWASEGGAICRHRGQSPSGLLVGAEASHIEPASHPSTLRGAPLVSESSALLRVGWHWGVHNLVTWGFCSTVAVMSLTPGSEPIRAHFLGSRAEGRTEIVLGWAGKVGAGEGRQPLAGCRTGCDGSLNW